MTKLTIQEILNLAFDETSNGLKISGEFPEYVTLGQDGSQAGYIKMQDTDTNGWTYITSLNGVLSASDTPPA